MSHPAWLTAKFIECVLKDANNDNSISVIQISVTNATNKGDNYSSELYRVNFDVTRDGIAGKGSVIVKANYSTEGVHKDLIEDTKVFDNEIQMMTKTLREMESVLQDGTKFGGRCYYSQVKNPAMLIIEDLTPLGFKLADRQAGLDLPHCKLALQRLAKFHASSVLVCEKDPQVRKDHRRGMFSAEFPPAVLTFFISGMRSLAKTADSWPELSEDCKKKLKKIADAAYSKACEIGKLREDEFNVINHGDFWVNNMMFKYDKGNITDHIFVDFQMCHYGTPAFDLLYFLNTSVSEEVLMDHKDHLIEEYHKTLFETMRKIGCKTCAPTLEYITTILAEKEFIGFLFSCTAFPIMIVDKSDVQGLEEMLEGDQTDFNAKANEMSHPAWLTAKFIECVLKDADNDNSISVTQISVTNAINKGDNYSSELYRVNYDVTQDGIAGKGSVIVKASYSTEGVHKDLIEETKIFDNEIQMMTKTLREMESVLQDGTKFGGRCYYSQVKNPAMLIIEDLTPLGFKLADRQAGLDLPHCKLALQRLAKFHASSVLVCEKDPQVRKDHRRGMFSAEYRPAVETFYISGMRSQAKTADSWSELSEDCRKKLKKIADSTYSKACEIGKLREDEFNVINHGDFWVNNMMFKYDKGNITDHIFVDFQMCHYGTPAFDLLYFLNSSIPEELLMHHKDYLIGEYHKTLFETMRKIECKTSAPTLEYITKILAEKEFVGFLFTCTSLPTMIIDKSNAQDLEEMLESDQADFNAKAELEWLTEEFIQNALRNAKKDNSILVTNMVVKNATDKGDNYTSEMYRVYFDLTCKDGKKKCSVIVKTTHRNQGKHTELVSSKSFADLFGIEMTMMTSTLREMESVLKDTKLGGLCYFTRSKDPKVLMIEDLAPLGFKMANRHTGLDFNHCTLALQGLAKFHASSVLIIEKNPELKEIYSKGMFEMEFPEDMSNFFVSGMKYLVKAAASWPELRKDCRKKIEKIVDVAYDKAANARKLDEKEFNVINHGDFWVNNMMFKYNDKGDAVDHIFVSFINNYKFII
ncbi:GSCOCG00008411001-RA-CDS [Cotesia congregata]|nr:GSCOCG00008411001-RA-CDS [Cotesia congregata]